MSVPGDVLVVDDDPDMLEATLLVLEEAGYETRSARNGEQALAAVAARMPALVLLDMLMPVMDGWRCARELRARYGRRVPIVVLTAAEHVRSRGEEIEADDVLPKPFGVAELLQVIARYTPGPGISRPSP
jgi:two-component system, OmpR family, response regulator MprA